MPVTAFVPVTADKEAAEASGICSTRCVRGPTVFLEDDGEHNTCQLSAKHAICVLSGLLCTSLIFKRAKCVQVRQSCAPCLNMDSVVVYVGTNRCLCFLAFRLDAPWVRLLCCSMSTGFRGSHHHPVLERRLRFT